MLMLDKKYFVVAFILWASSTITFFFLLKVKPIDHYIDYRKTISAKLKYQIL